MQQKSESPSLEEQHKSECRSKQVRAVGLPVVIPGMRESQLNVPIMWNLHCYQSQGGRGVIISRESMPEYQKWGCVETSKSRTKVQYEKPSSIEKRHILPINTMITGCNPEEHVFDQWWWGNNIIFYV